jgi:predicted N-acetyltransferase YhbS
MPEILVRSMEGHPEWIEASAAWWHRQWGEAMGYSLDGARIAIEELTMPGAGQAALVALLDGVPAGSAFLVRKDLESHTHLTPWLAGLLVLSKFRRMGLGRLLTAAVVEQAATLGHTFVYLYTSTTDFYRRQGWVTCDKVRVHDVAHEVMMRDTRPAA